MNEEKKDLLKTFQSLDKNGDGQLTTEELLAGKFKSESQNINCFYTGYRQTMDKMAAEEMVANIMESCDLDKSGKIDYNGEEIIILIFSNKINRISYGYS